MKQNEMEQKGMEWKGIWDRVGQGGMGSLQSDPTVFLAFTRTWMCTRWTCITPPSFIREFKKTKMTMATGTSLNKRFNVSKNGGACAL